MHSALLGPAATSLAGLMAIASIGSPDEAIRRAAYHFALSIPLSISAFYVATLSDEVKWLGPALRKLIEAAWAGLSLVAWLNTVQGIRALFHFIAPAAASTFYDTAIVCGMPRY